MIEVVDQTVFNRIAINVGEFNPTGRLALEYLAEGAANVLFTVRFTDSSTSLTNLSHADSTCVLRLRKDLPFVRPVKQAIDEFESRIAPIFEFNPSLLLPPSSLELSADLVSMVNAYLNVLEASGIRPAMRHGVYLPSFDEEPRAIIMRNLFHIPGTVVEFKPKWLVQSPSAPRNAQRCRTCALNAMRRHAGRAKGKGDSGFCPFDLLSSDQRTLTAALSSVWQDADTLDAFANAFRVKIQPALRELQTLQRQFNDLGLASYEDPEGRDFAVALALRDCSAFVKAVVVDGAGTDSKETQPSSLSSPSVAINVVKLIDLDLKDAGGGKLERWAGMEKELIDEGWYTDTSKGDGVQCAMLFQ